MKTYITRNFGNLILVTAIIALVVITIGIAITRWADSFPAGQSQIALEDNR